MSRVSVKSVTHVLWDGNVGGIERLVLDLAVAQIQADMDVTVVFGRASGPMHQALESSGARVIDLSLRSGHDLRPSRIRAGFTALRTADVVHLHGFNPAFGAICVLARRPVVFTEHGNFGLGRKLGRAERLKRRLQGQFLERAVARVAANSRHTAGRVAETYGLDVSSVEVVHNGTELSRSSGKRIGTDVLRVVFLGRLVPFKRVDRVLEGLAQAARRARMHLEIVGEGPMENDLRALAAALGVEDRVAFLGRRDDVRAILGSADVLVLPSENEPFGLAILEACACGALPVVFADGGGALEALPPDGLVVETAAELGEALDDLLESQSTSAEARHRRRDWVEEHFPIGVTMNRYAELYESISREQP